MQMAIRASRAVEFGKFIRVRCLTHSGFAIETSAASGVGH